MASYTLRHISSLSHPLLHPYRTLRRPKAHLDQSIFVAEAEKVVRRFIASDWPIISLLMTQEWFDAVISDVDPSRLEGVDIFIGEKELLETIVGFTLHQGIMGVGRVPREQPFQRAIESLPSPHFLVALDGLVHAENVGAVVRNCAGFGVDAILVGSSSASPYLRRAVRNSMGGIFKLRCNHVGNLAESLALVHKEHRTTIIVADSNAPMAIQQADFSGNICIVLGNEDEGVSPEVHAAATNRVRIPMHKGTDSLNVASASAVLLYQASKNR